MEESSPFPQVAATSQAEEAAAAFPAPEPISAGSIQPPEPAKPFAAPTIQSDTPAALPPANNLSEPLVPSGIGPVSSWEEARLAHPGSDGSLNGPFPDQLRKWNWGAFMLSLFWGTANRVWISYLAFIPIFNLLVFFYLGAKGNELAWQKRKFDSISHFKKVQKAWSRAGITFFLLSFLFLIGSVIYFFAVFGRTALTGTGDQGVIISGSQIKSSPESQRAASVAQQGALAITKGDRDALMALIDPEYITEYSEETVKGLVNQAIVDFSEYKIVLTDNETVEIGHNSKGETQYDVAETLVDGKNNYKSIIFTVKESPKKGTFLITSF